MSYFNAITSSYFKKSTDGRNIFYPWGLLGTGYVIPTDERTLEIKKSYRNAGIISLFLVYLALFLGRTLGWYAGIGMMTLYGFAYYIFIQILTRKLEKASERLTFAESSNSMASQFS